MWRRLRASLHGRKKQAKGVLVETMYCFSFSVHFSILNFSMFCGYSFKGRRIAATKIVFLVTDGRSNFQTQLTIPKAKALKDSGVKIFVVAVGTYILGIDEMVKVASYPPEEFLFRVKTHQQFWEVIKLVIKKVNLWKYTILQGQYDPPC